MLAQEKAVQETSFWEEGMALVVEALVAEEKRTVQTKTRFTRRYVYIQVARGA